MRASAVVVALCALTLAACAAEPPRKSTRKRAAPPARTAPAKPAARPTQPRAQPPKGPAVAAADPVRTETTSAAATTPSTTPAGRYAEALELLRTGQLQSAEDALRAAARDFPQQTGPVTNLGIVLARMNRKNEAAAAFARAVVLDPKNAAAHNWQGVLARERGDHARAEQHYRQALVADPAYAPAQLNLAILYDLYLQRPADALAAYRRYDQMADGKDPRAAVWIAELQSRVTAAAAAAPVPAKTAPATAPKAPVKKGAKS